MRYSNFAPREEFGILNHVRYFGTRGVFSVRGRIKIKTRGIKSEKWEKCQILSEVRIWLCSPAGIKRDFHLNPAVFCDANLFGKSQVSLYSQRSTWNLTSLYLQICATKLKSKWMNHLHWFKAFHFIYYLIVLSEKIFFGFQTAALEKAAPTFQKANGGKENAFFFPPFAFLITFSNGGKKKAFSFPPFENFDSPLRKTHVWSISTKPGKSSLLPAGAQI